MENNSLQLVALVNTKLVWLNEDGGLLQFAGETYIQSDRRFHFYQKLFITNSSLNLFD
jgi:hypothetical protein